MHRHTSYLVALGIAVSYTMAVNPCRAETVTNNDKAVVAPEPISNQDINNPNDKSVLPSDAVSQTSVDKAVAPVNPRIPIPSRIFPALQQ